MRVQNPVGRGGESIARNYLESKGYHYLESNWHCRNGEIDLVMLDGNELVLVEVKTRRTVTAGNAEESVGVTKRRRALTAGQIYVAEHPQHADRIWRIDVVAVTISSFGKIERISHVENAVVSG